MERLELKSLISEKEIQKRIKEMGATLTDKFRKKDVVAVCVLKGCFIFCSDLLRAIDTEMACEFLGCASYGDAMQSSGEVKLTIDMITSIQGKHVLLVEDIVDTGSTLKVITELLKYRGAKSVKVVTLLDKPEGRKVTFVPDYIGKTIPKKFVVGYGLDYQERYRNLPYVGVLKPEVYEK